MRKKLLTLVLAATMALSFAACGSNGGNTADNRDSSTAQSSSTPSEQSSAPEASSSQAEDDTMTLADWLKTSDAQMAESASNSQAASSGMTISLAADGDILVYEYHINAGEDVPSSEALDEAFGPVIESYEANIESLYSSFESSYGIKLGGVRFSFFDADGNEIYSGEVLNEN